METPNGADNGNDDPGDPPARDKGGKFLPGVSGNPSGKPRGCLSLVAAVKRRLREVLDEETGETRLDAIADNFINNAMFGEVKYAKELFDRLDGRAIQTIRAEVVNVPALDLTKLSDDELEVWERLLSKAKVETEDSE